MTINASDRTLGLISIWQVLRKLCWEIQLIKEIPASLHTGTQPTDALQVQDAKLYAKINAASTALALVDWLYHSLREDPKLEQNTKDLMSGIDMQSDKSFLKFLRQENLSINACHQICNANKHFYLRKPDNQFKVTVFEFVTNRPDGTFEIGVSPYIMRNGDDPAAAMSVLAMLEDLSVWWTETLTKIGIPGREQFFR